MRMSLRSVWGHFASGAGRISNNMRLMIDCRVSQKLQSIFRESGLKVATQNYEYRSAGNVHSGQNVYGIIQAPRGDGTEAIVLVAAWKTIKDEPNLNGVTLALTLARYFKSRRLHWYNFPLDIC